MTSGQTSKNESTGRGSTDREMWSHDLAWLLTESDAALGQRSTTGAVIAVIEHGGVIGSSGSGAFHEALIDRLQLRRGDPVDRHRKLSKRWHSLEQKHRRVLIAHYVGVALGRRFEHALGEVAAVATQLWLDQSVERRGVTVDRLRNTAADALELVYEELARAERVAPDWYLETWRVRHEIAVRSSCFLAKSTAGIAARAVETLSTVRRLRSERDALLSAHAAAPRPADLDEDLNALDAACRRGDVGQLRQEAEGATREAHRVWNATGHPEPKRTKREARAERVSEWLKQEGLT